MSQIGREFSLGLRTPMRGLRAIRETPHCKSLTVVPFLIFLGLFVAGLTLGSPYISGLVGVVAGWLTGFGFFVTLITFVVPFLMWSILIVALAYLIFLFARIIAAPFHSLLAERVLIHQGVIPKQNLSFIVWLGLALKMTLITIVETFVLLLIGVVLFILSFVPGLNVIAGFAALLIMAFDSADYSFEVLGYGLKRRFEFFFAHFGFFSGLAAVMGVTLLIPVLNLILFPAAVAGSAAAMKDLLLPYKH